MGTFGTRLQKLRKNKNMTQGDLASVFNISKSTIGMYEQDRNEPDFTTLCKIAKFFSVTSDYLLGLENKVFYELRHGADHEIRESPFISPTDEGEAYLLNNYNKLNENGKQSLIVHSKMMLMSDMYPTNDRE